MCAVAVAPVFYVTVGAEFFEDDLFLRHAEGNDKKNLEVSIYFESFSQGVSVYRGEDAAGKTFFCCAQKYTLSGYAVVAEEIFVYFGVTKYDDVGGWPFALVGAWPVGQIRRPAQMLEYSGVFSGVAGKNVL